MTADLVCVGAIAGAFGVRGEVRIKSFCAEPSAIEAYSPLLSQDGAQQFTLSLIGTTKGGFTARIMEITNKEHADAHKGTKLYAPRNRLPGLDSDEYYYSDLIGLRVLDTGGAELGKVKAVLNHGADDLIEMQPKTGGQSALIPFTKAIVPTVDIATGTLIIDPPEGLF